jgi:predicted nucleic acid-binding protein
MSPASFSTDSFWLKRAQARCLKSQEYRSGFECLAPDETTSLVYARIRAGLPKTGIKLPDPDYWIAAHALQHHLPPVTTDTDLNLFPGVRVQLVKA